MARTKQTASKTIPKKIETALNSLEINTEKGVSLAKKNKRVPVVIRDLVKEALDYIESEPYPEYHDKADDLMTEWVSLYSKGKLVFEDQPKSGPAASSSKRPVAAPATRAPPTVSQKTLPRPTTGGKTRLGGLLNADIPNPPFGNKPVGQKLWVKTRSDIMRAMNNGVLVRNQGTKTLVDSAMVNKGWRTAGTNGPPEKRIRTETPITLQRAIPTREKIAQARSDPNLKHSLQVDLKSRRRMCDKFLENLELKFHRVNDEYDHKIYLLEEIKREAIQECRRVTESAKELRKRKAPG